MSEFQAGKEWSVEELISIAQSFDWKAHHGENDPSARTMAFNARKYARTKVNNE